MKNTNSKQTIAIIGGMGPQASTKLLEVLITMCSEDYGANDGIDYPEIILNSIPVPEFNSNKNNIDTAFNMLKSRVKDLEIFNPVCFGIACNTAHVLLSDLQNKTKVSFVSIIDEVVNQVSNSGIDRIGLLATPVTISSRLYQSALKKKGINVITPSLFERKIVEEIIRNIIAGKSRTKDKESLILIAENLLYKGSQGIILGCTELPLIFPKNFPIPIFDSIEILAEAMLKRFFEKRKGGDSYGKITK